MKNQTLQISVFISVLAIVAVAQTGGTYDLSHAVVASGGGSNSTGGTYVVDGTIGQGIAGTTSSNGALSIRGGFWAFQSFAPTASLVSVSGKVRTKNGSGIRNVFVTLTASNGSIRSVITSSFGFFKFEEIEVGQTYILNAVSKKLTISEPTRILTIQEDITGLEFLAEEF